MLNIGKLCLDTDFNFRVIREEDESKNNTFEQIDLFTNYEEINKKKEQEEKEKN